jgi:hypothetical protein
MNAQIHNPEASQLHELGNNQARIIEKMVTVSGVQWESIDLVYHTKEAAGSAAAARLDGWANGVFMGLVEHHLNGKIYYAPAFNVFD